MNAAGTARPESFLSAKGWLFEANVIDQAGPILTEVVKEIFGTS
ncbi:MAG: hypothetical protein QUS08_02605 [Methanothrix sp.]|nr:hypothetical protein [Methanothrix sp.]